MENSNKTKKAIKLATKELLEMSDEDFNAKWNELDLANPIEDELVKDRKYLEHLLKEEKKINLEDFAFIVLANLFDSQGNAKEVSINMSELRELASGHLENFNNIMKKLN